MDFVIQKAVELGVNEIVPFMSRYTIVRLDQKKRKKRKIRWERIAKEAAKQCQRDVVPIISDVIDFSEVVIKVGSKQKEELVIMPWELANSNGLKEIKTYSPKIVSVIIGPEGGFSEDEVSQIKQVNGIIISLGPRILRTETAGLVTLALAEYRWGDLGITMEG